MRRRHLSAHDVDDPGELRATNRPADHRARLRGLRVGWTPLQVIERQNRPRPRRINLRNNQVENLSAGAGLRDWFDAVPSQHVDEHPRKLSVLDGDHPHQRHEVLIPLNAASRRLMRTVVRRSSSSERFSAFDGSRRRRYLRLRSGGSRRAQTVDERVLAALGTEPVRPKSDHRRST